MSTSSRPAILFCIFGREPIQRTVAQAGSPARRTSTVDPTRIHPSAPGSLSGLSETATFSGLPGKKTINKNKHKLIYIHIYTTFLLSLIHAVK